MYPTCIVGFHSCCGLWAVKGNRCPYQKGKGGKKKNSKEENKHHPYTKREIKYRYIFTIQRCSITSLAWLIFATAIFPFVSSRNEKYLVGNPEFLTYISVCVYRNCSPPGGCKAYSFSTSLYMALPPKKKNVLIFWSSPSTKPRRIIYIFFFARFIWGSYHYSGDSPRILRYICKARTSHKKKYYLKN